MENVGHANFLQEIPKMNPENLEKILSNLPEPTYAEIIVYEADYSAVISQAEKIAGIELIGRRELPVYILKKPLKAELLQIYRREYETRQLSVALTLKKEVELHKVSWLLDNRQVNIELTPWELKIRYSGEEPSYISRLIKSLSKSNVRMSIDVNK